MAQNCDGGESNSSSVRGGAGPSGPQDPGGRNQATGWRDPGAYRGCRPAEMSQSGVYGEKNLDNSMWWGRRSSGNLFYTFA